MKLPVKLLCLVFLAGSLIPARSQDVWVGNSMTSSNWSDVANWQSGMAPQNGDPLLFQGSNRTTNNNDLPIADIDSFTFDSTAAAFTLQGKSLGLLSNGITNNSANLQTFDFTLANGNLVGHSGLVLEDPDTTITAAAGPLSFLCNIEAGRVNVTGPATLTFTGDFDTTVSGVLKDDPTTPANTLVLVKSGLGTLTLTANNAYTGGTTINAGTLVVAATNALGSPATTNDVVLHGGTLQTDMPRTFLVPHDYHQDGGTLRLQIGGLNSGVDSDLMEIVHDAFLGGNVFFHQVNGFTPTPGDRVTVITTNIPCTVNGAFDSFADDFPGMIRVVPEYFQDHVDAVFEIEAFSSLHPLTPNQKAVAAALDEAVAMGCSPALIDFLGMRDIAELPHDFDLIAPEELASIYEIGFSQAVVYNDNLIRRMDDIRAGSSGYCGPIVQTMPSGKDNNPPISDKNAVIDKNPVAPVYVPCPENHWGVFATGSGDFVNVGDDEIDSNHGHRTDRVNADGYDIETGSVIVGVDYRIGSHFAIGVDGAYAGSTADLVNGGRVDVDGGKLGAYMTLFGFNGFFHNKIHLDAGVSGGWNSYDTRRIGLEDLPVRGSTDGSEFNAFVSYGGDWTFGCFSLGTWSTLQYTDVDIDGFNEEGSLAPLHIAGQDQESIRATTGIRAAYDFHFGHCGIVRPEVRAAYQHEYGDRRYEVDARFLDCDNNFKVFGPEIGRDAALVGAGVNVQWSARFATYVYYDGVLGRNNYDNNAVSGGFRFGF